MLSRLVWTTAAGTYVERMAVHAIVRLLQILLRIIKQALRWAQVPSANIKLRAMYEHARVVTVGIVLACTLTCSLPLTFAALDNSPSAVPIKPFEIDLLTHVSAVTNDLMRMIHRTKLETLLMGASLQRVTVRYKGDFPLTDPTSVGCRKPSRSTTCTHVIPVRFRKEKKTNASMVRYNILARSGYLLLHAINL